MKAYVYDAAKVLASRAALKLVNFFLLIILIRVLTERELGVYGVVFSGLMVAVALGNLGVKQALTRLVGQQKISTKAVVKQLLFLLPIALLVTIMVFLALTNQTVDDYFLIVIGLCGLALINSLAQGIYLGLGKIGYFNYSEVTPKLILFLFIVVLSWFLDVNIEHVFWAALGAYMLSLLPILNVKSLKWHSSVGGGRASLLSEGWKYGIVLALLMFNERVGIFYLNFIDNSAGAGRYFAILQFNQLFWEIASSIGLVLFSHAARSKGGDEVLLGSLRVYRLLLIPIVIGAVTLALIAEYLLPLLISDESSSVVSLFQVLVLGLPLFVYAKLIYPVLAGLGKPLDAVYIYVAASLLNILAVYFLIGTHGELAVAMGLVISYTVVALGLCGVLHFRYEITWEKSIFLTSDDVSILFSIFKRNV